MRYCYVEYACDANGNANGFEVENSNAIYHDLEDEYGYRIAENGIPTAKEVAEDCEGRHEGEDNVVSMREIDRSAVFIRWHWGDLISDTYSIGLIIPAK